MRTMGRVNGREKWQRQARKIEEHVVWTPDENSETATALRQGLMRASEDRGRGGEWRGTAEEARPGSGR